MGNNTVTIIDNRNGSKAEFPIRTGTHGPAVIDITNLYKNLGMFTYDPGFLSTASCESRITFIDGEKGILLYRGYPIEQLAEQSTFLEVCYLLLYGDLPNRKQLDEFVSIIIHHSMINESLKNFYNGFRPDAHPMAIMVGVVGALSAFYHDSLNIFDPRSREISAHRLIAKMPTIAANSYRYAKGLPFNYPDNTTDYVSNFIQMMWSVPCEPYRVNPIIAKALDVIFILHADHEQNASTSTVRLAGSSQANPFACVSAGIGTLWGPSHGGANEEVLKMLEEIGEPKNIAKAVERAKDKNDPFRLMGFGHRVYKNYDPRAKIIRKMCHDVLSGLGMANNPLFEVALKLEEIALNDAYFVERKLYPNVDFYSGIIQKAIGIPVNMFTVIFAIARTVGWISQWTEMIGDPTQRIGRPRQTYTGEAIRNYVPVDERR